MSDNKKMTVIQSSNENLIKIQTAEEAVSDNFFNIYEQEHEALNNYKEKMRIKRENKRLNDKKKDPIYKKKHLEILEEREHKGFVLQLVQNDFGYYMATSPMFKKGCYTIQRKTAEAAFKQGQYIIHCVYNYEDIKEEFLTEEGLDFVKNSGRHSCSPWEEKCICEGEK